MIAALLIAFKLWLTYAQILSAKSFSPYDARLFLTLAKNLSEGEWLGPYDAMTLIKGPFFSFWIAGTALAGIPLLLSVQVLYACACWLLAHSVRPLLKSDLAVTAFLGVLLFNPASHAVTCASRELIYTPLVVLVVAFAFALFFAVLRSGRMLFFWAAGFGLSVGCLWLTREEGVWVVPFSFFLFVCSLAGHFRTRPMALGRGFASWGLALGICLSMVLGVSAVNYVHYGVFGVSELRLRSFKAAYGALTRVRPKEWAPYVPVTSETRRRIYAVSPAFRELEPFLDGKVGERWSNAGTDTRSDDNEGEILGGWFVWAFRESVAKAGYYGSGKYPVEYYRRLAREVNGGCADQDLECYGERRTLAPVTRWELAASVVSDMGARCWTVASLRDLKTLPERCEGTAKGLRLFREMTHDAMWHPGQKEIPQRFAWRLKRYGILNRITGVYELLMPFLGAISIVLYTSLSVKVIRRRELFGGWAVQTSLIVLLLSRLVILSTIHVTAWRLEPWRYLWCGPAIVLAFVFVGMLPAVDSFARIVERTLMRRWPRRPSRSPW